MMYVQRDVHIYTETTVNAKKSKMLSKLYTRMMCSLLLVLQSQGNNLHIVKEGDKLQELSRVPTCHTNMKCNLSDLFIPV